MQTASDKTKTGIEIIGDVPWGTHFCQFYRTQQDLLDTLVPYFKAGLESNEYCMWVTSEPLHVEQATGALRQAMPDFERYAAKGSIEIIPHSDWYMKGGNFEQSRVLNGWVDRLNRALDKGYDGLRLTGNTFWLESSQWQDFKAYENVVNNVIGDYRMIAACTYSLDKCGASEVIDVVQNHQFALIKREGQWVLIEDSQRKRAAEEIGRLNEALARKAEQIESTNRDLESFAYSVSHDLRVPLRAIDGFSQLLLKRYGDKLDDEGRRLLNVVRDSAGRMGQMIGDILAFSRTGRLVIAESEVNMENLARAALEELAPNLAGRDVKVEIGRLPQVHGDPAMLRQVWINLLANAVKFTRPKPAAQIEVEGKIEGAECTYFVKDNGVGFDMQYAGKLFGVFQRLHGIEEFEGTGIGLATAKRIVTRHGGRVWAEGRVNEGATFYFALPV